MFFLHLISCLFLEQRLRTACERAKRLLSTVTQTTIELEVFTDLKIHQISKVQKALSGSVDFNLEITRAKFEDLCKDLFAMTLKPVEQVLKDSKLDVSKVVMIFLWFVFAIN